MKYFLDLIWRYIGDIFIDSSQEGDLDINAIQIQDLTLHYKQDFPKIALDSICVGPHYFKVQGLLEEYKYNSDRSKVVYFSQILQKILQKYPLQNAAIVTIPMHWSRYTIRGFDHMDYLIKNLIQTTHVPYIKPFATTFSHRQSKLSREKRLENRKNQFTIKNKNVLLPKRIFLIDDVISTGATAHECAKILKEHGVEEVIGIFLTSSAE